MIIKSLSRKAPTFRQLKAYMDRGGAPGVGFAWNLGMPWFASDADVLRAFIDNAATLRGRRNGVQLFHEIVSLKRDERLPLNVQQQILHDAVMEWLAARAPDQIAYGRLHVEREHLHVHVMLSANRLGDDRTVRLSRTEFAGLQRQVEARILARYPALRQERTYDVAERSKRRERSERSFRHPRSERDAHAHAAKRSDHIEGSVGRDRGSESGAHATGRAENANNVGDAPMPPDVEAMSDGNRTSASVDRDHVAAVLRDVLSRAPDGRSCLDALRACGIATHRRGSTVSFAYQERRYRLLSLGLPYADAARFHAFLGLPPPAPGRVARAEERDNDRAGETHGRENPNAAPSASAPKHEKSTTPETPSSPTPSPPPAPSRETPTAPDKPSVTPDATPADQGTKTTRARPRIDALLRVPVGLARDARKLAERGLFGDTRAAYWGELVRAYRENGNKPGVPPRRDLPGTRRVPLFLRRILGAIQDEPAAIARDLKRIARDVAFGKSGVKEPSLEDVVQSVGFRSLGPKQKPPQKPPQKPARNDNTSPTPPAAAPAPAAKPAKQALVAPATPRSASRAQPAPAPTPPVTGTTTPTPAPNPYWQDEWRRRQAVRTALLRSYVRQQERERERAKERERQQKRQRARNRGRDDPGRGG
jgi:hypothetical protein